MPTPERTTTEEILSAARDILETDGLTGLTIAAVAKRVGIRSPSLHKRVGTRDELVGMVADATVADLADLLQILARDQTLEPRETLAHLAYGFRNFAKEHPVGYQLIFGPGPKAMRPRTETLVRATGALVTAASRLVGPADALAAARLLTAWAHGFVSMELSGAFRMDGDVDHAFVYGLDTVINSLGREG